MFLAVKHFFHSNAAVLGHLSGASQFVESRDSSLHKVVRVRRTLALCKHVSDAHALKHCTHSAAGLHTGTLGCGLEEDARTAELGALLMRNCAFVPL